MTNSDFEDLDKRTMDIIVQCAKVNEVADFSLIAEGPLRVVLPHEMMVCGIGGVSKQGNFVRKFLSFDCPYECYEYYQGMLNTDGRVNSPLIQKWRDTQEPVYFQSGRDDKDYPDEWVKLFNKFNMRNTLGHGVLDLTGTFSSYFIFSRLADEVGPEHAFLLKILTPHLHLALVRALTTVEEYPDLPSKTAKKPLSERQQDILYWLHEGKTNWEIAKILELTELNVKYHIDQIFTKLDVRSRVHAVAKGHELNLIRPPKA